LAQLGVTPNTLTIIGLILSALTAIVVAQGFFLAGGLLVLFAGIFDMFDGAMARVRNAASAFGAFFDSTLDRYSESIILFGLLYYALQRPDLHDVFWPFSSEQSWMITLIYITVVGSLMVSYAKARAEGLGLECKTGLLARPERVVILAIGLLSGTTIWALALLAIFSHITAIERIAYIWRVTRQSVDAPLGATRMEVGPDVLTENADSSTNNRHSPTVTGTNEAIDPSIRPVPTSVPPFTGSVHQE
jgi:CDP-diacylglycerol--glycerol-3-phosphate 3-phosphatidyltransferase